MKNVLLIAILLLIKTSQAFAQADTLMRDENGKYLFYQVVSVPNIIADTLYNKALTFFRRAYTKDRLKLEKADDKNFVLNASGGVLVSKKSMKAMHEDASVRFNFFVEIKDAKYRYWFTDFIIIPYQRDRYANYVPVAGKKTELEKGRDKLSIDDYNGYLNKVTANCREIGAILKSYMTAETRSQKKEVEKKAILPKEW